jgi:hypothetical protein
MSAAKTVTVSANILIPAEMQRLLDARAPVIIGL